MRTEVLNGGFVELVRSMGGDGSVVEAARVTSGASKSRKSPEQLIRYLMRHGHDSPFEFCQLEFHVRAPIYVARQWVRHRTASWNEVSGRLSAAEAPRKRGRREVTVRMNAELRDALAEYILIRAGCVSDERAIRFHVSERGTAGYIRERAVGRDLSKPSARDRRFIAAVDAFESWFKEGA